MAQPDTSTERTITYRLDLDMSDALRKLKIVQRLARDVAGQLAALQERYDELREMVPPGIVIVAEPKGDTNA